MNRTEIFTADNLEELQEFINAWCGKYNLDPLSVSIAMHELTYIAAVVVKERE